MRDDSYLESRADSAQAAGSSVWQNRATTAAGALISVALLGAVVVWSYRLGVRDAAEVPVIQASTDVFKIRPEDPGGLEVDHQDRSVYTLVSPTEGAAEEGYAPPAETLADEDLAPAEMTKTPVPKPEAAKTVTAPQPIETEPAPITAGDADAAGTTVEPTETAALDADALDPDARGPLTAPRPMPRPVRKASVTPDRAEAEEPRSAAAASSIQIQLGAFASEDIAAGQWTAIKSRNGDILNGRGRVIMPVKSGGKQLYRLRAGPFETVADAAALCRGLKSRGEACIVARAR